MKTIMILGASILQVPAILKAKEMGYKVIAVDMNPNAVGFQIDGIQKEVTSTIDINGVLKIAKENNIDGIMTLASDIPMRTVAFVARELGLVGIDIDTAIKATNKYLMRKALLENGVPVPRFFKVSNQKELLQVIKMIKPPFVIKPSDNSGSRGITLIDENLDENAILENYNYSLKYSRNGDVVIEEYMNGPEVSVETIAVNGKCQVIQITDKITTGAPHFVEIGHSQPSRLPSDYIERIKSVAIAANAAIGIQNGPSHTEIIYTIDGPKVVEIGARLGGDCITTHLVPLSTGVDMVESSIKICMGEEVNILKTLNNGSAIRYFNQHSGVLKAVKNISAARKIKGISDIQVVYNIGDKITEISDSSSRIGFVIARGETVIDAVKSCEEAMQIIDIQIGE